MSRLNFLEIQPIDISDSEHETDNSEFLNERDKKQERVGLTDSLKDSITEQQLLELRNLFQNEIEHIKSEMEKSSSKLQALELEIVEDFDIYIQDLKKVEFKEDIRKYKIKLDNSQRVIYSL